MVLPLWHFWRFFLVTLARVMITKSDKQDMYNTNIDVFIKPTFLSHRCTSFQFDQEPTVQAIEILYDIVCLLDANYATVMQRGINPIVIEQFILYKILCSILFLVWNMSFRGTGQEVTGNYEMKRTGNKRQERTQDGEYPHLPCQTHLPR